MTFKTKCSCLRNILPRILAFKYLATLTIATNDGTRAVLRLRGIMTSSDVATICRVRFIGGRHSVRDPLMRMALSTADCQSHGRLSRAARFHDAGSISNTRLSCIYMSLQIRSIIMARYLILFHNSSSNKSLVSEDGYYVQDTNAKCRLKTRPRL